MGYAERDFQIAVNKFINTNYPDFLLFSVPNEAAYKKWNYYSPMGAMRGAPDLVLVTPYKTIFLECKSATGQLSAQQQWTKIKCQQLSQDYYVIKDLNDLISILKNLLPPTEWKGFV